MSLPAWVAWLGSVGVTLIVATGRIFEPVRCAFARHRATRPLGKLVACTMCVGFWAGAACAFALGHRRLADLVLAGGAVSLASYAADLALRRLAGGRD